VDIKNTSTTAGVLFPSEALEKRDSVPKRGFGVMSWISVPSEALGRQGKILPSETLGVTWDVVLSNLWMAYGGGNRG